jgi:uncharacterized membrane protein YgdD (TMEM256/DUF423 family)
MYKQALTAGAIFAMLAVILGAFGAHALKERLPADMLQVFETGVRYEFYHSFALLATGILYAAFPVRDLKLATTFFIIGIALFSGSLYAMALMSMNGMGIGKAGVITPIGGLFLIIGWVQLLFGIIRTRKV